MYREYVHINPQTNWQQQTFARRTSIAQSRLRPPNATHFSPHRNISSRPQQKLKKKRQKPALSLITIWRRARDATSWCALIEQNYIWPFWALCFFFFFGEFFWGQWSCVCVCLFFLCCRNKPMTRVVYHWQSFNLVNQTQRLWRTRSSIGMNDGITDSTNQQTEKNLAFCVYYIFAHCSARHKKNGYKEGNTKYDWCWAINKLMGAARAHVDTGCPIWGDDMRVIGGGSSLNKTSCS